MLKRFFFFKQKTAYEMRISDWSSDVCSSDLQEQVLRAGGRCRRRQCRYQGAAMAPFAMARQDADRQDLPFSGDGADQAEAARLLAGGDGDEARDAGTGQRSEERRVGKEGVSSGRSRCSPYHEKKKKGKQHR